MNERGGAPQGGAERDRPPSADRLHRRHLRVGWWTLLVFLALGLVLEGLHGFKVRSYLDVSQQTRRLMWTLGHAHGTLLGLVNLAFAATLRWQPAWSARAARQASRWLLGATACLPAGFVLGGLDVHAGDPGLGIVLAGLGGLMLLVAVLLTALGAGASAPNDDVKPAEKRSGRR
jgi:hypothetical protein